VTKEKYTKLEHLDVHERYWKHCGRCELCMDRKQVVNWRGSPDAKLFVIGEAPGRDEDEIGSPFVGKAGRKLDELFYKAGLQPNEDVFIANVIGCRPPNNRLPRVSEVKQCRERLAWLLLIVKPTALLLLGGTAALRIAGITAISKWQGCPTTVEIAQGRVIMQYPAIATFHPSYLVRIGDNAEIKKKMISTIKKAKEMACR